MVNIFHRSAITVCGWNLESATLQIRDLLSELTLYDFESVSVHFGILGIKGLSIFLKKKKMEFVVAFYYFNLLAHVS